ncbi:hypothetical protein VOLCADRAFT_87098 [Volvox carteri f. nagariensis]|uniref:F-box domain-containing protein n=1 Tax=Volvox carteri f. nagariensis TaxID=3068 RepID=D8TK60_VOLCA|nr:uncharacterized protein VOLCADRAFT_87098 [Volvox carteri f. nagariensis]EFJ52192.1 hypothetical protein VOLCADRAFT_87098 [Volvox carteri f. nagariensis]|eukprot:XP_002946966.1 hypothetical protein VOLCADRAFT_87098 [Volvox carteri f. nagariensis]
MDVEEVGRGSWAGLNLDILERIGCELALCELLSARLVCQQWRRHVAAAVKYLPHAFQHQQRQLVELDAQPSGRENVWERSLAGLAACLPQLSEIMVYVSSRVSADQLAAQLHSLPASLPALTKLELRYIVPSSVPCLGTSLQQLQPSLTKLTGLDTLYLIMGASPEPGEVAAVLSTLSSLRDLKLLSGLPQYGFTNAKLEALGSATQLQRLHLEVSGVGQVDAGLAALSRLRRLRQLWLDGLVTLGPAIASALQQLPDLQELRLELDSPQHIPDLFALSGLKRLSLMYHGDELDDADDVPPPPLPPPPPLFGPEAAAVPANLGPGGGGGGGGADWDALELIVRGHTERPVLRELGLLCCSFPADPLPRLAMLTSLTSLTFYDCRWKAAPPRLATPAENAASREGRVQGLGHDTATGPSTSTAAAAASAAVTAARSGSWGLLTSLVGLQGFGMAQCVVPPICELDLVSLAAAWPGVTSLQLQSAAYRISQLPLLPLRPPPARFGAFLARWRRLEALTLSGSWCNDPRVALDVSLLPPSLTSLILSSVTLINSAAANAAILERLGRGLEVKSLATGPAAAAAIAPSTSVEYPQHCSSLPSCGAESDSEAVVEGECAQASDGSSRAVALPRGSCVCCGYGTASDSSGAVIHTHTAGAQTQTQACSCTSSEGARGCCCTGSSTGHAGSTADSSNSRACGSAVVCNSALNSSSSINANFNRAASHGHQQAVALPPTPPLAAPMPLAPPPIAVEPDLPALEHLVLGEVRLGSGVSLQRLVRWAPNLRSLEINNLLPNLTDDSCTALAALTALTVLRVSQDQELEAGCCGEVRSAIAPGSMSAAVAVASQQQRPAPLSGMGLMALTGLKNLRQLEWLPWGCEPLDLVHVEALGHLQRLHLITLRSARDGAIVERALETLRDRLPLCDIDDTEWSGLVDV